MLNSVGLILCYEYVCFCLLWFNLRLFSLMIFLGLGSCYFVFV